MSIPSIQTFMIILIVSLVQQSAVAEGAGTRTGKSQADAPPAVYPHGSSPLPGLARPIREVTMASPLEGMLMTLEVREGQRVRAGEVLATMDNRVTQAAVGVAQAAADCSADLQHAREELELAQSLLDRLLKLRSANSGTSFEVLETRTRLEQARARVAAEEEKQRQAKRRLELEQARLEAHNIRAPFDGEVVQIHAFPGATLTRDDELLTLVRLDELKVELHVPLELYSRLQVGQEYSLDAGPPLNHPLQARLTFVAPIVDSATNTFRAVFTIANQNGRLPAGFTVHLSRDGLGSIPPVTSLRFPHSSRRRPEERERSRPVALKLLPERPSTFTDHGGVRQDRRSDAQARQLPVPHIQLDPPASPTPK
jgi:RND family efflux transporter MFP subunit